MASPKFEEQLRNKRVLITGHTGFTGAWLAGWLSTMDCEICGLALEPNTTPSLFLESGFIRHIHDHIIGDITDREKVNSVFRNFRPEVVFHLAAQPIVSAAYEDPFLTFDTNVMGTLNILEAARNCDSTKAVVCVTTDKVYDNREWVWGYRECDPLGGTDPYSASKSACEMVINTYQKVLAPKANHVAIAAARGGNIIGGGDWAQDRIVPDFVRAAGAGKKLELRNPDATRPWQHVLALVHGYIQLASALLAKPSDTVGAWNFGSDTGSQKSVGDLVGEIQKHWPNVSTNMKKGNFKESHFLSLSSEKAEKTLGWQPGLDFSETVEWTSRWYRRFYEGEAAATLTEKQIIDYRTRIGSVL